MYGMIHRGLHAMVLSELGAMAWQDIESRLDIGPPELISAMVYDDALTLSLVTATAEALDLSVPDCLRRFGRYWVDFARTGPYGRIMDFAGRDIAGFIANLDNIHQSVASVMPGTRLPSFTLLEQGPGWLKVAYASQRAGLEPLVIGLMEGLLDLFGLSGEVSQNPQSANAREFLVTYHTG